MLTSPQSIDNIFFCPEESDFYSHCLETLVLRNFLEPESIVEFGSGDGSPVIKSLLRTKFDGIINGFELNRSAWEVATSNISRYQLNNQYVVHNRCLFESEQPSATYLISNPPYLPALDSQIRQPLLRGGIEGIAVTKKLLSLNYPNVLMLVSSYSNPIGLLNYAQNLGYAVANFSISPMQFGYYSSEPKVKDRIAVLRESHKAFYSDQIYLLAGVLFTKNDRLTSNLSTELMKLITTL